MVTVRHVTVIIDSAHSLGGGKDVLPGDRVRISENEARLKVARGWAHYPPVEDGLEEEPEQEQTQGNEPAHPEQGGGLVTREPRPQPARAPRAPRGGSRTNTQSTPR